MVTIKKILVPLDFSDASQQVLAFGRMLADACDASIHLLHIISPVLLPASIMDEKRRDAVRRLNALLNASERQRHATVFCDVGTPAHEIVRYAADHAIDLIVMGTHWHGPTFHMATGSIAESVLGMAPCAVLALKGTESGVHVQVADAAQRITAT
jgi:universal stress protein A